MEDQPDFRGEFAFSYKSIPKHCWDFIRQPLPILIVAIAIFGALWTFGEAAIQFTEANPRGIPSYIMLVALSIIASIVHNGYLYIQRIPDGLEQVSKRAQRIAHLQRPLWEFRFAKTLLAQKLAPYERELNDMEAGRHFVVAEKPESLQAYMRWSNDHIQNLEPVSEPS